VRLRSPFNGEVFAVPPDQPTAWVEALEARGFTRIDSETVKGKRKPAEISHER
jgi:hypothetical protein